MSNPHSWISRLAAVVLLGAASRSAWAQELFFVDHEAVGTGTGLTWADAYTDLWTALESVAIAHPGENVDIWVADGEYRPQIASGVGGAFILRAGVHLYGGFAGGSTGEEFLHQRNPADNITILDGRINYTCDEPFPACGAPGAGDCDTAHLGLGCEDEDCCCSVCKFSPSCCNTSWDEYCVGVAAAYCGSTRVQRAANVVVRSSPESGGLRVARLSGFTIQGGEASGATVPGTGLAPDEGGGILVKPQSKDAGMVRCEITLCRIVDNFAESGGGIAITTVNPTVDGFDSATAVRIHNCEVMSNTATVYGAGILVVGYSAYELVNTLVARNGAEPPPPPSAIQLPSGAGLFEHVLLPDENAPIPLRWIINCTITRNMGGNTPGIEQWGVGPGVAAELTIVNSIVRDNLWWDDAEEEFIVCSEAVGCAEIDAQGAIISFTIFDEDPVFVAPENDDFRLQATSPAIDAGSNAAVPFDELDVDDGLISDPEQWVPDLLLRQRVSQKPGGGDCLVDIGAYELQSDCEGDLDNDGSVDGADLGELLAGWGDPGIGDLDCDGTTDGGDLGVLLSGWSGTLEYPRTCASAPLMGGGDSSSEEQSEMVLTLTEVLEILGFSTTHEFVTWVTQLELEEFLFWMELLGATGE